MSTRYWGVDEYGILLDREEVNSMLVSRGCDDADEYDECDIECELGLCFETEFTGEAWTVFDGGLFNPNSIKTYCDETVYYYRLWKQPNLFSAAYKDSEEIEAECRNAIGEYLPDDFDYIGHLHHIVGTYYG